MSALIIMCVCVCVYLCVLLHWEEALSPNCCLLSHCQSDYEILFNLLGGRVLCDFDESDLLFLHSLYCLVVRCRTSVRSSVLSAVQHTLSQTTLIETGVMCGNIKSMEAVGEKKSHHAQDLEVTADSQERSSSNRKSRLYLVSSI